MNQSLASAGASLAALSSSSARLAVSRWEQVDDTKPDTENYPHYTFIAGMVDLSVKAGKLPTELAKIIEPPKPPAKAVPKWLSTIYPSVEILGEEEAEEAESDD